MHAGALTLALKHPYRPLFSLKKENHVIFSHILEHEFRQSKVLPKRRHGTITTNARGIKITSTFELRCLFVVHFTKNICNEIQINDPLTSETSC